MEVLFWLQMAALFFFFFFFYFYFFLPTDASLIQSSVIVITGSASLYLQLN